MTAATLPDGWTLRTPEEADLPRLIELRALDERPWVGDGEVDPVSVESVVIGQASWTRRQVVAVDDAGTLRAWVIVQDRASGRAMVTLIVDREVEDPASVAAVLYAWAQGAAISLARLRGIPQTRLDASPFADDAAQKGWLADAGYTCRRTWLHMTRPVAKGEQVTTRPGVTVRIVRKHSNGIPVAQDLQTIHQVLEESFQDHFNSYRETFPEFLQRLREDPGHRWDHWWLAFVDDEDGEETEETE
ncbi:GNAT family N-acetyltransferase, partial [Phycicoccus elongatus]|uniref:GNAT family N-acetyltransferase n=1 Tax=Phycicoccus elongatus TaxID=101689 RepID=UPI002CBA4828